VGATAGERAPAGDAGVSPLPIYLVAGTTFASMAVRGVLFPLHAAALGANRFEIGLLFTSFTVTAALLSLPSGYLADRFGRRPMLVGSLLAGAISQVAGALTDNITVLLVCQAIGGLGAGASQAVLQASLADIIPTRRLGQAMGWLTLAYQSGFLIGPALAGVGVQFLSIRSTLMLTTLLLVAALPMTLAATGSGSPVPRAPLQNLAALRELSGQRGFLAILIGLFAATLVWGTVQGFLPIFGKQQLKLPNSQIGYLIAVQAVANGLARVPGGLVIDRIRQRGPIAIGGVALYAVGLFALPYLTGFWAPALLLSLTVPLLATAFIAISVAFVEMSTPSSRGVAMGLYGTVLYVGLGFGPLVFGPVMERYGYVIGFSACAATVIALAGISALARMASIRRHRVGVVVEPGR
jgi:MFS family permease